MANDDISRRETHSEQQDETDDCYEQSVVLGQHLGAVWETTRAAYVAVGIGIDYWPSDKRIVRRFGHED